MSNKEISERKRQMMQQMKNRARQAEIDLPNIVRTAKIKRHFQQNLWHELMAPLTKEIASVRGGKERSSAPVDAARVKYIKVLIGYRNLLKLQAASSPQTPAQFVREFNAQPLGTCWPNKASVPYQLVSPIPNNGHHWTDWIPQEVKKPVEREWYSIPPANTGRPRRQLFPVVAEGPWFEKKCSLLKSLDTEIGRNEDAQAHYKDSEYLKIHGEMLLKAKERLLKLPPTKPLPATYWQLWTKEERQWLNLHK